MIWIGVIIIQHIQSQTIQIGVLFGFNNLQKRIDYKNIHGRKHNSEVMKHEPVSKIFQDYIRRSHKLE